MSRLLTALSIQDATGSDVPLMADGARKITKASGLAGIRVRELVTARSGRHGSRNRSRNRDDAQITLDGILIGADPDDTWTLYDTVAGALAVAVDTDRLLKWTAGDTLTLQQQVRLSALDGPLEVGPNIIRYQAVLRGSDPNVYSQTEYTASATALSGQGGGFVAPFIAPFTVNAPPETVAGVTNNGFVDSPPIFELAGYLLNPIVRLAPGVELQLAGEIAAGDTLTIDVAQRSVLLNDAANRRSLVDTANSTWFEIPPGASTITLLASDFSAGAGLTVRWRDARE